MQLSHGNQEEEKHKDLEKTLTNILKSFCNFSVIYKRVIFKCNNVILVQCIIKGCIVKFILITL